MNRQFLAPAAALALALYAPPTLLCQNQDKAELALRAAMDKENLDGNLKAAIDEYKKLAQSSNKSVAARALLRLGECYEKQGSALARQAYEQVVSKFGDQREAVAQARVRLAAIGETGGMTTVSIRRGGTPLASTVAWNKPLVPYTNRVTGDLMLLDLTTGEERNLTNNGPTQKGKEWASNEVISADGKLVAYEWATDFEEKVEVRTISTDETGIRIAFSGKRPSNLAHPVDISPDRKTILVSTMAGGFGPEGHPILQAVSLTDGSMKPFAEGFWGGLARFSPDGKSVVLSSSMGARKGPGNDLFLANADGSNVRPLLIEQGRGTNQPCWTPDGKWIAFVSQRAGRQAIWVIPFTGGEPKLVKEEPDFYSMHGFTRDGALYYTVVTNQSDVQMAKVDSTNLAVDGEPVRFIKTFPGRNDFLSFSSDGKWAAWESYRPEGKVLVVRPTAGGEDKVLSRGFHGFQWIPDGESLLVSHDDGTQAYLDRVDSSDGRITQLYRGPLGVFNYHDPVALDREGRVLAWTRCSGPFQTCDLVRYDRVAKSEAREPLEGIVGVGQVLSSPDGKWLAIRARQPTERVFSLFIRPAVEGGKLVELVKGITGARGAINFTPDSKRVLYAVPMQSEDGAWEGHEFRSVPIDGGPVISIPLAGGSPSMLPDGLLAYTQSLTQFETSVVRNLRFK